MSRLFRSNSSAHWAVILCASVLIAGCAGAPADFCPKSGIAGVSDQLYFGMEKPGGVISESEWRQFLEEVVTPRFPEGFSWWIAEGQWQEPDGRIVREGSRVLQVIHPVQRRDFDEAVAEIIQQYKTRFNQTSVLHMRSHACISF